jgi:hypothetical protein
MTKITSDHLARSAYVYVRQSSMDQLLHNPESRRRQYALTTRARALGWDNVIVIDDDLGFERLLLGICSGDAGAVCPRGLAPGSQWARLTHPFGVLRLGGQPDHR